MATTSMLCVQVGLAVSVSLIGRVGPEGAAWLRLVWAGAIFLVLGRPWRLRLSRSVLGAAVLLGVATASVTLLFMAAVARLPLGTASALEFLGPLGVAVARGSGRGRFVWPPCAAVGVLLLTEPWAGTADPVGVAFALAAACCNAHTAAGSGSRVKASGGRRSNGYGTGLMPVDRSISGCVAPGKRRRTEARVPP